MTLATYQSDRITPIRLVVAALLAAAGVLVWLPAFQEMFTLAWRDQENSHVFLVLPVAAALVYVRRQRLRHFRIRASWIGPVIVLAGWLIATWGFNHARASLWHGGSVVVVVGCIVAVLGKNVIFRFFPAVLLLALLVPVPGIIRMQIAVPLQAWTAEIAQVLLAVMGVQTDVSGNTLSINGEVVTIAEACNGMRLVFPLMLTTYAFAFGLPLRNGIRITLLVLSPVIALVSNVLRTTPIIWLYGRAEWHDFADQVHDWTGWLMLIVAFLVLLFILKTMSWAMLPVKRYTLANP
ncbi:MAG: exosortase/archaeosortase family protein [Phycisphaerae bacterium]